MKSKLFPSIFLFICSGPALHAADYVSDFSGLTVGGALVGIDGWTQSADNYGPEYPLAFGTQIGSSNAAAVGGYFDTEPPDATGLFYASHATNLPLSLGAGFSMKMAIVDSEGFTVDGDPTLYGTERNSFSVGIANSSGTQMFALIFDPEPAEDGPNNQWKLSWTDGAAKYAFAAAVIEDSVYELNLGLNPNGADVNFAVSIGNSINSWSTSGVIAGASSETFSELRVGIEATNSTVTGTPQFGTNHLAFNEVIVVVPEPSSLMLLGITTLGLVARRRRSV